LHRGNAAAAVVTQSSYARKGTAAGYMSVQNSMMEWDLAQYDCVGVIRNVTSPRRNDKVKRRTTLVFDILITQELWPFTTRHAQASYACQQEVQKKKKPRDSRPRSSSWIENSPWSRRCAQHGTTRAPSCSYDTLPAALHTCPATDVSSERSWSE